jgi:protein N-terminal glutamine amidohydrolase
MTTPTADGFRYQPFYCEENVWWLLQEEALGVPRYAVFVTNRRKQCPIWGQRAGPVDGCVVWDYHVVALTPARVSEPPRVWDLDSRLGFGIALDRYLDATFPLNQIPEAAPFAAQFRVVEAEELLALFRSDRSHMRDPSGAWRAPPPPWSPPGIVERHDPAGAPRSACAGSKDAAGPKGSTGPKDAAGSNLMRFLDLDDDIAGEVLSLDALRARFAAGRLPS